MQRPPNDLLAWYVFSVGALVVMPYLSLALAGRGLTERQIALLFLLLPLGSLIGAPLISRHVERAGVRRAWLLGLSWLAVAAGALFVVARSPFVAGLGVLLWSVSRPAMTPIVDALTTERLPDGARGYGRIRRWGSLAFLVSVVVTGQVHDALPAFPFLLGLAMLLGAAITAHRIRFVPTEASSTAPLPLYSLLRLPALRGVYLVGLLHGMTLSVYDGFFALLVDQAGLGASVTGWALGIGVACEIALMGLSARLLSWISPRTLLALGVASGIPRWWVSATTSSSALLVGAQALHGLGFGAFWVASIALIAEHAPRNARASATSLLPATSFGAGRFLAMGMAYAVVEPGAVWRLFAVLVPISALASLVLLLALPPERETPIS